MCPWCVKFPRFFSMSEHVSLGRWHAGHVSFSCPFSIISGNLPLAQWSIYLFILERRTCVQSHLCTAPNYNIGQTNYLQRQAFCQHLHASHYQSTFGTKNVTPSRQIACLTLTFNDGTRMTALPLRRQLVNFVINKDEKQDINVINSLCIDVKCKRSIMHKLVQMVLRRSWRFSPRGFPRWEVHCLAHVSHCLQ